MTVAAGETWIACLTPPGTAALATLALWGPRAWTAVRELFRPELPADPAPSRTWLGHLGHELTDQVVVAAKTRKGLPWVEVHCHGGPEVIRMLLDAFKILDIRICSWPELWQRCEGCHCSALAGRALSEARTVRTASILLDQYSGAFDQALAALEAARGQGDRNRFGELLAELVRYTAVGRHLTAPWRVVVAGAPNVGKSSLVNALAGYQRCIVAPTPGTTRDLVTATIALDGWPVELIDTAGLRQAATRLETQGIDLALEAAAQADLCLWVLDASQAPVWPSSMAGQVRYVINKMDLPPVWDLDRVEGAVKVSALTGSGLPALCAALARWLVPNPPPPGAPVPFTPAMCSAVEDAWHSWSAGRDPEFRPFQSGQGGYPNC